MKKTTSQFQLYRYQILPVDRYLQGDLLTGITTIEQLLERKNEFVSSALKYTNKLSDSRHETVTKKLFESDDFFLFRVATNRSLHRETKEFKEEYLDNWPSVLVAIWNHPDVQLIAIQKRTTAFQYTETVVRLIIESITPMLSNQQLRVLYEPLFEKKVFWDIVDKHKGKIQKLEFEFLTPNMANISTELPANLKEFAKATNSVKNKIDIESDAQSSLHVEQSNPTIQGLVNYSSDGGGNIVVKILGAKKKIHTSKTIKEIEIGEMQLQGSADEIAALLKDLMK